VSIEEGADNSLLITNDNGELEWATIEDIVQDAETVTLLEDNGDGTYTYTSEDSTKTVIDVPASVVENFETIVNDGPVEVNGDTFNTVEVYIIQLSVDVSNVERSDFITVTRSLPDALPILVSIEEGADNSLLITNDNGELEWATIEDIVQDAETVTLLEDNGDGTYTYTSEDSTKTFIDVPASVVENFETIVNDGPVTIHGDTFNTVEEYLSHVANESVTLEGSDFITVTGSGTDADPYVVSIEEGADNSLLITNDNGELEWATIEGIVQGAETVTLLEDNGDGTYTYTSEDSTKTVIDVPASVVENFETIVNDGPVEVNGDTFNTVEEYIIQLAEDVSNVEGSDFITVTGSGTDADPYAVSIEEGADNSLLITNDNGELEWATIEDIVQDAETVTLLEDNGDGTYT